MQLDELNQQLDFGMRVYVHYLGAHIKVGKHYKSPFGHDGRDSFDLFRRGDGQICFCDHAMTGKDGGELQGSCYDFVAAMFSCDFKDAVRIIKRDILGLSSREIEGAYSKPLATRFKPLVGNLMPEVVTITPNARHFTPADLAFFARTGITEATLARYHCYALNSYQFSKGEKAFTLTAKDNDPMYGFHFPLTGHWKIYRPFAADKRYKWISNVDAQQDLFGWDALPDRCSKIYICAGQRDTMNMHQLTGLPAIALNSETAKLSPEVYQLLTCIADEVLCCLDNDDTGHKAQERLRYDWGIMDAGREVLESTGHNDLTDYLTDLHLSYGEGMFYERQQAAEHFQAFSARKLLI
ncbi:toprim domain-containing protein [Hymenobacter siberiensis]|uniref:toprim domain-containing protein n=1 Tax=Hymenobacter siberiensis TaxID=2848396 RepID=UPI001C1E4EC5|nr:toprim domain-containing protein [Hymenobacter siberiensis]